MTLASGRINLSGQAATVFFDALSELLDEAVVDDWVCHVVDAIYVRQPFDVTQCNYGGSLAPLDKWFGTFHDGSEASAEALRARLKARRVSARA